MGFGDTPRGEEGGLKGKLIIGKGFEKKDEPKKTDGSEPRLTGKLITRGFDKKDELKIDLLTNKIEFGNFGSGIGDIETDGFSARNSNNSSNQDSFAVSSDKKTFVVTDGMGGSGSFNPVGVAKLARAVAEVVAQMPDIRQFANEDVYIKTVKSIKEKLEKEGVDFVSHVTKGLIIGTGTTVSAVQRTEKNLFNVLILGDSPVYIIDRKGKIIKQYGEDIMKGGTDSPVSNSVFFNANGEYRPLKPDNKKYIINETIKINPGELLVIGSDFFSDHTYAGRNLNEYINLSSKDFHTKAISKDRAKGDDATLIVIDPEKLK